MTIRESQIEKIINHRREFFAARDRFDAPAKGRAAAAWLAAVTNASREERQAANDRMPDQCPCGKPFSNHWVRGMRFCSEECAMVWFDFEDG